MNTRSRSTPVPHSRGGDDDDGGGGGGVIPRDEKEEEKKGQARSDFPRLTNPYVNNLTLGQ
jgi:hypothetical protein